MRSGGQHSDPVRAVEVRRGPLRSRGCCSGPAGNTCDLELAVVVVVAVAVAVAVVVVVAAAPAAFFSVP